MTENTFQCCPICGEKLSACELPLHVDGHFDDGCGGSGGIVECHDEIDQCEMKTCLHCSAFIPIDAYEDHLFAHSISDPPCNSGSLNDSLLARLAQEDENGCATNDLSHCSESDRLLAQKLQHSDQKQKEEEEFKKLQETYGMINNGGYSKQFESRMDRQVGKRVTVADYYAQKANVHSELIHGIDSGKTRTSGLIEALKGMKNSFGVKTCYLCTVTDHLSADVGDSGWGCGYRNLQMLLSSLLKNETFSNKLITTFGNAQIPSVPNLQTYIEEAWKNGYDKAGCNQLGGRLMGTRKWIGTTEVVSFLRWMKIKARIVDFHKPTSPENTHVMLFEWIEQYFKTRLIDDALPPFPLYLQHQGHSRLCIGIEELDKADFKTQLLLFDPSQKPHAMQILLSNLKDISKKPQMRILRRSIKQMKSKQFQIVFIDGVYEADADIQKSKVIQSLRIP